MKTHKFKVYFNRKSFTSTCWYGDLYCDNGIVSLPEEEGWEYMRFTGLVDGKGKDIYEGDVVEFRANYSSKPCGYMKGKIVFNDLQWMIKNEHGYYSISDETDEFYYKSEVIGNVFENPEIL